MIEKQGLPSNLYDKEYYLKEAGGLAGFNLIVRSKGRVFPEYYAEFYKLAGIKPGMKILDVGCGRGEFVIFSAIKGAFVTGIDYSKDAIEVAKDLTKMCIENSGNELLSQKISFKQADAKALPFADHSFDRIVSRAVVEHLHPWELNQMLSEVKRVLKKEGQLVICTNPNIWYMKYVFPLVKWLKKRFPALTKISGEYIDKQSQKEIVDLHVNEQSPLGLKIVLKKSGFNVKIRLEPRFHYRKGNLVVHFGREGYFLFGAIYLLEHLPFVRWLFCDNIYALAKPRS